MKLPPGTIFRVAVVNDTDLNGTAEELRNWSKNNTMTVSNNIQTQDTPIKSADTQTYSDIMTVEQVAKYLQVSTATVQQLVDAGTIKSFKVGDSVRIKQSDVDSYISSTH